VPLGMILATQKPSFGATATPAYVLSRRASSSTSPALGCRWPGASGIDLLAASPWACGYALACQRQYRAAWLAIGSWP
jgi:hypothetical protein